jgi:hypothetical protein
MVLLPIVGALLRKEKESVPLGINSKGMRVAMQDLPPEILRGFV